MTFLIYKIPVLIIYIMPNGFPKMSLLLKWYGYDWVLYVVKGIEIMKKMNTVIDWGVNIIIWMMIVM